MTRVSSSRSHNSPKCLCTKSDVGGLCSDAVESEDPVICAVIEEIGKAGSTTGAQKECDH